MGNEVVLIGSMMERTRRLVELFPSPMGNEVVLIERDFKTWSEEDKKGFRPLWGMK